VNTLAKEIHIEDQLMDTMFENKQYFYRIAKRILLIEEDVEDAFQDTVMKAFKSIRSLKNEQYLKTWVTRILINQCFTILNKRKTTLKNYDSSEIPVEFNYNKIEMKYIINQLDYDLKMIAILFYYEDLPQKEIGEILNIPVGTVKSRLSTVRRKLKEMLEIGE
jgi:RNA polymerase sigma-70 factor (ECF subfamily)